MCSYAGLWKIKIIKLEQFPWWHIGLFDPLYSHMVSELPRQLKLIIILPVKRDHAFFIHPPSPNSIYNTAGNLSKKRLKSCSTTIIDGDTERQLRWTEKSTKYGVRRSSWVLSQPPSLLAWPGTSNFYFSHVKAPSIIWRTNRMLSKCLFSHVCLQLCAKHYGKGVQRVQRSVRLRLPAGSSQYGGKWKLVAQSFIFFILFSQKNDLGGKYF